MDYSSFEESYTPKIIRLQTRKRPPRVASPTRQGPPARDSRVQQTSTGGISCANVSDEAEDLTVCWTSAMASGPRQNSAGLRTSRSSEIACLRNRLLRPLLLRQLGQLHRLECLLLRRLSTPRDSSIGCNRRRASRRWQAGELLRRGRQH